MRKKRSPLNIIGIDYYILRIIRRIIPNFIVRFLLNNEIIIRPGLETSDPDSAAKKYIESMREIGVDIKNKRVLIFGYGGSFGVGAKLLDQGASHVILADKFAKPNNHLNNLVVNQHPQFFIESEGKKVPDPKVFTLWHDDIVDFPEELGNVDVVLSSSVFEHVSNPEELLISLSQLSSPGAAHIHYIDLRDHYFKYPFAMLTFSDDVWKRYLNPPSNLNRMRSWNYVNLFKSIYAETTLKVLDQNRTRFDQVKDFVQPQFLSNDDQDNSVCSILITAKTRQ